MVTRNSGSRVAMKAFANARDEFFLQLQDAPFSEKLQAYEQLKGLYLKNMRNASDRLEVRRRIAEDLLEAATTEPWRVFLAYLRRLRRLGFSAPHVAAWTCSLASSAAKGNARSARMVSHMIGRTRQQVRSKKMHSGYKAQVEAVLDRAAADLQVA